MNVPPSPHGPSWTGWTPVHGIPVPDSLSNADPRLAFVLRLGRSLHSSGYSAQRLEDALILCCDRLGLEGQFFSTPTSIMASFGPNDDQRTFMIRVEPGDVDLGKLARVDEVARDVLSGRLTPAEGKSHLEVAEKVPTEYGPVLTTLAFGMASASASRFLGGGWMESGAGLMIGLIIGLLALGAGRHPGLGRVFEPVAAFTASALASLMAVAGVEVSVFFATLAGVIVLVPGLTITTAITELSTRHLASGTARLMGALVLMLSIAFGIALGTRLVGFVFGSIPIIDAVPPPTWSIYPALVLTPLAFTVLLKAESRDAGYIVLAGALAYAGVTFGAILLGPELGAFGGALMAGVGAYGYSRITNRPSQVTLVPGLLLLVPGSIGLRSVTSMMDRDVLLGVEGAFRMGLIAVSLATGILIARIISPRRPLME